MIALLLALSAEGTEWRSGVGTEIGSSAGFGILDLAFRKPGQWEAAVYTDTLDVRWTPESDRGKGWLGGRIAGFAGGMQIAPWTDGRPDPSRSRRVAYAGPELGIQRYLRHGVYVGAEGWARGHGYGTYASEAVPLPDPRLVVHADAVIGWWRPWASARLLPGVDVAPGSEASVVQPHLVGQAQLRPDWTVHPRVELRGAWAEGQDDLTLTRVGGLNPYVVPVGGAAWAEWWAEDLIAGRVGPELAVDGFSAAALVDAVVFDGQSAVGFAVDLTGSWRRMRTQLAVGHAPWIERPDNSGRTGVFFLVGADWGRLGPGIEEEPSGESALPEE